VRLDFILRERVRNTAAKNRYCKIKPKYLRILFSSPTSEFLLLFRRRYSFLKTKIRVSLPTTACFRGRCSFLKTKIQVSLPTTVCFCRRCSFLETNYKFLFRRRRVSAAVVICQKTSNIFDAGGCVLPPPSSSVF